jgi:cytoskeletal protein CcmA (bactofilin family)
MSTVRIQVRRGTAAEWTSVNPTLAAGEMGVETDTRKIKVGTGNTAWTSLSYIASDSPAITEIAQDAIDQALSMGSGLTKSYNDNSNTISLGIDTNVIATNSYVDNAVGGLQNTVTSDYVLLADVGNAGGPAKLDATGNLLIPKSSIILEGATANDFETTLTVVDPTADRTITFPDATTTVVGTDTTQTLSNKTLTTPTINGGEFTATGGTPRMHGIYLPSPHFITFEGTTNDEFETVLEAGDPTADRTITLPNASGTVALTSYVDTAVANLVDAAPETLNTLNDLAEAIGNDANYATTLTTALGTVVQAGLDHTSASTNVHGIADVSLLTTVSDVAESIGDALTTHNGTETNVHGISNTADLMLKTGSTMTGALTLSGDPQNNLEASTKQYVDDLIGNTEIYADGSAEDAVTTHAAVTQNVHGIADTSLLATKAYADTAESDAISTAQTFTTTSINALDTDDIEEGTTNKYYTSIRSTADAVAAMSDGGHAMATDSLEISTNDFNVGADAKDLRTDDAYTNPIAVFSTAANDYAQVAIKNTTDSSNSSSDIIAYASNGVDSAGYINMGITAPSFTDADFTITGGNDGYIFMEAPTGTAGDGNLVLATGANGVHNHIVFAAGGLQSNNTQMTIFPDEKVHIEIDSPSTSSTTGALTVVGGVGIQGDMNLEGNLDVNGQVDLSGVDVLPIGPGASTFAATLTNPTIVAVTDHDDYAQIAHQNISAAANASTDIIMYTNNGTDAAGYIDMGITSSAFSDPDFTITGPGDGYIFVTGSSGNSDRGNLVLATGNSGTQNKIVFAAGGLASDNEQMTIIPDERVHIEINTPSTSPTTGALTVVGGVGIQGDLNIQGDVDIQGTIVFGGAGTTVETSNLSVTDPLVFTGSGNAADTLDLGLVGEYKTAGATKYAGIVRDASDGVIKAFKDASTKPTSSVNFAEAGLGYADMQVAGLTASSLTIGDISNTEFGYLNGVTSSIQTQIDAKLATATASSTYETISNVALKAPIASPTFTGVVSIPALNMGSNGIQIFGTDPVIGGSFTSSIQYSDGTLYANGNKLATESYAAPKASPTFTGTVTVSGYGITFSDGTQTKVGVPSITAFGTTRSSSETLISGEQDKFIPLDGAVEITLPSSGYSTGQSIDFYQASGTGAAFASTNSVVGTPGLKFRTTNSVVTAMKTPSGWLVFGDLKA